MFIFIVSDRTSTIISHRHNTPAARISIKNKTDFSLALRKRTFLLKSHRSNMNLETMTQIDTKLLKTRNKGRTLKNQNYIMRQKDRKVTMFKLLARLSVYFKYQPIKIDNAVFRLHNVFTTVLLMTCSIIITATQYVGNPIQCIVSGLPTNVVNTFCWITSTFTMPDAFTREVRIFMFYLISGYALINIRRD